MRAIRNKRREDLSTLVSAAGARRAGKHL